MASETLVSIKWNPQIFKTFADGQKRDEVAKTLGISRVFLEKLIAGKKKLSVDKMTTICAKANVRPNDFFEIVTKNSR